MNTENNEPKEHNPFLTVLVGTGGNFYMCVNYWTSNPITLSNNYCNKRRSLTGSPIWNIDGILRRIAASTSCGLFVAPIIIIWHLLSVVKPSQKLINWVLIITVASWSEEARDRKKESTNYKWSGDYGKKKTSLRRKKNGSALIGKILWRKKVHQVLSLKVSPAIIKD